MGVVRRISTTSNVCAVAWGWTDPAPTQFFYLATADGYADVAGAIANWKRKASIGGLYAGVSWNITITSVSPDTTLGSVTSGIVPPSAPNPRDPAWTTGDP